MANTLTHLLVVLQFLKIQAVTSMKADLKTCAVLFRQECGASGRLTMELKNYKNPKSILYNSECCDPSWRGCGNQCDNYFKFCLTAKGSELCSLGSLTTMKLGDDEFQFPGIGGSLGGGHTNPLTFSFTKWEGANIGVEVWDNDQNQPLNPVDDYVDRYTLDFTKAADPSKPTATSHSSKLAGRHTYMNVIIKVFCDDNYLIPDCGAYCVPRDNAEGHFRCNYTKGVKVCLEGWYDPTTNCVKKKKHCIPRNDTSGHYECDPVSGEKICVQGWTGQNCTEVWQPTPSTITTRTPPIIQTSSFARGVYKSSSIYRSTESLFSSWSPAFSQIGSVPSSSETRLVHPAETFTASTHEHSSPVKAMVTQSKLGMKRSTPSPDPGAVFTTGSYGSFGKSTELWTEVPTETFQVSTSPNQKGTRTILGTPATLIQVTATLTFVAQERRAPSSAYNLPKLWATTRNRNTIKTSFTVSTETNILPSSSILTNSLTTSSSMFSRVSVVSYLATTKANQFSSVHILPKSFSLSNSTTAMGRHTLSSQVHDGNPIPTESKITYISHPSLNVTETQRLSTLLRPLTSLPIQRSVGAIWSHTFRSQLVPGTLASDSIQSRKTAGDTPLSTHSLSTLNSSRTSVRTQSTASAHTTPPLPTTAPRDTDAVEIRIRPREKWSQAKEETLKTIITNELNRVCTRNLAACSVNIIGSVSRPLFNAASVLTIVTNSTDGDVAVLVKVKLPNKVPTISGDAGFVPSAVLRKVISTERHLMHNKANVTVITVREVIFPTLAYSPTYPGKISTGGTVTPRSPILRENPMVLYALTAAGLTVFIIIMMLILKMWHNRRKNKVQTIRLLSESRKSSEQLDEALVLSDLSSRSSSMARSPEQIPLKKKSPRIIQSPRVLPQFTPSFD